MANPLTRRALLAGPPLAAAARSAQPPVARRGPVRIVSTTAFDADELRRIEAAAGVPVEIVIATKADLRQKLADAEVLFGSLPGKELDYAPKLRWIQASAAGVEWIDDLHRRSPVPITNMARVFAPGIAETALGLLLSLTRRIGTDYVPQFLRREWKPLGTVRSADHVELAGRLMGIVGMGGIGSEVARRAYYGFGMRVVATDAKPLPKPHFVEELHSPEWFEEMVPRVDVLVLAAPLTAKTRGMVNEGVFRRMRRTAYFLALSRGPLFDGQALVKALKEGWIAGAGLDVFPQEPVPREHPIFDCPNVVMTPHTSGWGVERQRRLVELFAENVRRYAAGLPLLNVVDKEAGY